MSHGQLHHVEINVSDLKKSVKFWSWLLTRLGYRKFQKWDKGISYKLEDTYIVFVQTDKDHLDIKYHRKRTGLNHLAFQITLKSQIDQFKVGLEKRGIKILYFNRYPKPEYYAIFFEDPDRIKVELVSRKNIGT